MATYGNPGLIELTTATGQPPVFDNFKKNSSLTIDKTGLVLTTTSYNWGTAKATVKVHKGRWYYEVKMTSSGQARVGWATENYAPASTSDGVGSDADSFGWDGSRRTVHHDEKKIKPTDYGENWNSGDVIGCLLDFDNAIISFSRNGKSLGPAFKNIKTMNALMPCVSVYSRTNVTVELGPNFKHQPLGFYGVNPTVSAAQKKSLLNVFLQYHKKGCSLSESLSRDLMKAEGVLALGQDLGANDPMDPHLLLLAWKMRSKMFFQFYDQEWMVLWANEKVTSFAEMKAAVERWKKDVFTGTGPIYEDNFLSFYMFVFDYLRSQEGEAKMALSKDDALMAWQLLGVNKKWKLFPKWEEYWKKSDRLGVPRDTWRVLLKFMTVIGDDMKNYSEDDCWPMVFDDFAEFINKK